VSGPPGPPKLGHTRGVTEEPGGDFIVGPLNAKNRWSVVAMTVGLTAACAALVIWGGLLGLIGGLPGLVFFGLLCLPVILLRAVHPEPELVVSADGLTVNQSATDMGSSRGMRWRASGPVRSAVNRGCLSSCVIRTRSCAGIRRCAGC
jgi:hypothetical protein